MNSSAHKIKQTVFATAMATTLGTVGIAEQAAADILNFSLSGWFTMVSPSGNDGLVNGDAGDNAMYGRRTDVTGTMAFDTDTNSGTLEPGDFSFFGSGIATAEAITFQDIDGPGGAGTHMLGNMSFNWSDTVGIPVSIVWDGKGILEAVGQGLTAGDTVAATNADFACDTNICCALPAIDDFVFSFVKFSYTLPIGASPLATTTFNTTDIGTVMLGTNPSGTLPLIDDGIGGSPVKVGPFPDFNINFDFDRLTMISPDETVAIDIPGGDTQECTAADGKDIPMAVKISISDDDAIDTITWSLDGVPVANGESVIVPVSLGGHAVEVDVTTVSGRTFRDTASVTVPDTTAPVINAAFLDAKSGAEIMVINSKGKATVSIDVSDTCDASPTSSATTGLPVFDGDTVSARTSKKHGVELSIDSNTDHVEVMVTAEDASGNIAKAKAALIVVK
jgi:hypothetical protein